MKTEIGLSVKLNVARTMAQGVRLHLDELSQINVGEKDAEKIESIAAEVEKLNAEQENLKSLEKQKSAELKEKQAELDGLMQKTRKLVKTICDKKTWNSFGIFDKQ